MALLPVLAVYFSAQKYFVEGITLTSIKGWPRESADHRALGLHLLGS